MKIQNYFKAIATVAILFHYADVFAQNDAFKFSSPEASVQNGGNSGVDMFRGTLNSNIPLYNYQGAEIGVPISISYSANGIKVDQLASTVGLGWNLNAGGRMTKMVMRVPDGTPSSYNTADHCRPYANYEGDWQEFSTDRDYYKVTAPGIDEIVRVNCYGSVTCYTNPKVKVSVTPGITGDANTQWIITAEDGTMLYFGQNDAVEEVISINSDCPPINSATSWLLTKIVSKNKMDLYSFYYSKYEWLNFIPNIAEQTSNKPPSSASYKSNQVVITEIKHNDEPIISFHYLPRNDLKFIGGDNVGNALSEIRFYNYKVKEPSFQGEKAYRKVVFDYGYFGNLTSNNPLDIRLKLNSFTAFGYDKTDNTWKEGDQFSFGYEDQNQIPTIDSFAQDFLGLYNGKNTNTNLIPIGTTNREFDLNKALTGTLNKITYPNKGYSEFEYEQNALSGSYGTVYVPEVTESHVIAVTDLINFEDGGYCPLLPSQYWDIHDDMISVDLNNFPDSGVSGSTMRNILYANTVLMDLSSEIANISCKIETSGHGIYTIQKIDPCNLPAALSYDCGLVTAVNVDGCLIPTNQIFYNGISSSSGIVKKGLTNTSIYNANPSILLEPGKYQITIWPFDAIPFNIVAVQVKKETIETNVITPAGFEISDTVSQLVDGFRISSITNYDELGHFKSKKGYKYYGGVMSDYLDSSFTTSATGSLQVVHSSRGYVNGPSIVHYKKVAEVTLDENNSNNGYTKYYFSTQGGQVDYDTPLSYENSDAANPVLLSFTAQKTGLLEKKEIYNKDDQILYDEIITTDKLSFAIYIPPYSFQADISKFYYTSNIISHEYFYDPIGNSIIEKNASFICDSGLTDGDHYIGEFPYNITQKTVNGEVENYKYGDPYTPLENILLERDSEANGTTKYIYTSFNHGTTSVPIMRNLVTEIQHAKHGNPLESISQFIYDNNGNKVQTSMTSANGTPLNYESYIYGYNDRFVVAKLTGVPYSDITQLTMRLANIKQLSNNPVSEANENALIAELNLLRSDFQNAQITTYTYNPNYGVTSVTDPKGYTVFSEYDAFGRVKLTKERHKTGNGYNIISENQFHTISNP